MSAQRASSAPGADAILRTQHPTRPEIGWLGRSGWIGEALRHHAGDRVRLAIERERASEGFGIAAKVSLPEGMAHHNHAVAGGLIA